MTSTPGGATPGPSDSPEPDGGSAPDLPASADGPGQDETGPPPIPPQTQQEPHRVPTTPPGWSHQPPPADSSGWARWGQPPVDRPPVQAGPRWGAPTGPNGWQQQGPWSRPPAPKPGVIPLRPLGVGEILDGAISTLRRHWHAILGMTLVVAFVTEGISIVVQRLFSDTNSITKLQHEDDPSAHDVLHAIQETYAGLGVTAIVTALGVLVATALLTMVTSRAVLGRTVTLDGAWRAARPSLGRLVGLSFLLILLYVAVLCIGVLPGVLISLAGASDGGAALALLGGFAATLIVVWLWILLSLSPPALMLENQGIVAAMKRSAKLVRGSWWRVLGVELLTLVLTNIVSAIIELPFSLLSALFTNDNVTSLYGSAGSPSWTYLIVAGVGAVVGTAITLPVSASSITLLYIDQRIRRESLDLELIQAAQ